MKTNRTTGEKIANGLLAFGVAVALTVITLGSREANAAQTGALHLVATIKDGPAMQAVSWVVKQGDAVVKSTHSHSATFHLPGGDYSAHLECNGTNRSRSFTLRSGGDIDIVLACG
ncbi:MAG TPA: hypothetical protein PLE99_05970 [Candidatus Thiothrix moscowensis]|mgnify:CR=1 FL=1|uniref:hypothetical protein n=1 Tax=unclassified Thiothrix TaxID=2636184 RepID=UPI0025FD885F|nr:MULTISPECIES: hypothetical protein [unclassified Thiothrix]HRJ52292.1 hypothetical protein [Candidatus Thiothrix moscowensis]HRJ92607.1 hypothetical protein [Candidatus Thiothrix moscowensis]